MMQPEEEQIRKDAEQWLQEHGWERCPCGTRADGPSIFKRPKSEDTGHCIVTDCHICLIDYPWPLSADWVPIAEGLDFLKERHLK